MHDPFDVMDLNFQIDIFPKLVDLNVLSLQIVGQLVQRRGKKVRIGALVYPAVARFIRCRFAHCSEHGQTGEDDCGGPNAE